MVNSSRSWGRRLGLVAWAMSGAIPFSIVSLDAFSENRAFAQVTPDSTLGTQVDDGLVITGGTTVGGTNLFHSFSSFSIPSGQTAEFLNAPTIFNILGRVTGGTPSDIQGIIKAQGNANLFLINPSGIIFGPNARLDIGGSFVGTTANAIRFPSGGEFSMTSPVEPNNPVLAVNPSALFFNQTPAGAIVNQSRATAPNDSNTLDGLRVPDGRSLLLVGGDVRLDGGIIKAPGGRVDLGGLAAPGEVEIIGNNNLGLRFPDGVARADISLTNQAGITASIVSGGGDDAGIVILRGNNVSLDNSQIFSQILPGGQGSPGGILIEAGSLSLSNNAGIASSSFGSGNAGAIFIDVDGSVSLANSTIQSNVENGATNSNGGLVSITAGSFSLLSGSQLQTLVRGNQDGQPAGQGNAGRVKIDVRDTITIDGEGFVDGQLLPSAIFSRVGLGASGNAGNIEITTGVLSLSNRGKIDTSLFGVGTAGSIFIKATDSVSLTNEARIETVIKEGAKQSGGTSSPFAGNIGAVLSGRGGDVTGTILISTGSLSLKNGVLNSSTFGDGNAGAIVVAARDDVSINNGIIGSIVGKQATGNAGAILMQAESLSITSTSNLPAGLSTQASGQGNAGLVFVRTKDDISLKGTGSVILSTAGSQSTNTDKFGGAIILDVRSLFIKDGATVSVNNFGLGEAGGIVIAAKEDIILNNEARITAATLFGQGGSIVLTSGDFLLLLRGSRIATQTLVTTPVIGTGGNIDAETRYIIAAPFNDNNISAAAFIGKGGRIDVTAARLYDIDKRADVIVSNDITARTEYGRDGEENINALNADPTQGLSNLPANPVDPTTLIAETCAPRTGIAERQKNQFIVTGPGGLPPDPNAAFPGEAVVNELGTPDEGEENTTDDPNSTNPTSPTPDAPAASEQSEIAPDAPAASEQSKMVEAQGWVYEKNGAIVFTARSSTGTVTPNNPALTPASTCNALSKLPQ
ncbi:filamentous hemagglutinin N-terminal domain-containing protein [Coleofasciculus sp. H7-2]|uniref:two-partner secretion domain-containing protein n=1 Tax=Coleofasciculus sp. H7-2 TaxID=3351545 RepID=UPI00366C60C8